MTMQQEIEMIQKKIESLKQDLARSEGRIQQLQEQLQKEHGCKTTKEAHKKIEELEKEQQQLQLLAAKALKDYINERSKYAEEGTQQED